MSDNLQVRLYDVFANSESHNDYITRSTQIRNELFQTGDTEKIVVDFKQYVRSLVNESISLVVSRQLISQCVADLSDKCSDSLGEQLARHILCVLEPRAISFEAQLVSVREYLARVCENTRRWSEAASMLMLIPVDSGQKVYTPAYKLQLCTRIAQLHLNAGEYTRAETSITKASSFVTDVSDENIRLQFRLSYARVLDRLHKFSEASQRYMELSHCPHTNASTRFFSLRMCIVTTVLSSAGHLRSKRLAALYKDERCKSLPIYGVLENMYLDRIIGRAEMQHLATVISAYRSATPHSDVTMLSCDDVSASDETAGISASAAMEQEQVELGSDDESISSLLEQAIVEHNVIAVSRLFTAIPLQSLARLLGVDVARAETVCVRMMYEERVSGYIDQIVMTVYFTARGQRAGDVVVETRLVDWDVQVQKVCTSINYLMERVLAVSPSDWIKVHEANMI